MSTANAIKTILEGLAIQISHLTALEIQNIEDGNLEISIKLVRKKSTQAEKKGISSAITDDVLSNLNKCTSREEGHQIISGSLKNRSDLEVFARHLDVLILKQDKVEQIKDKIIEATVGAKLRSNAIQGKNATRP